MLRPDFSACNPDFSAQGRAAQRPVEVLVITLRIITAAASAGPPAAAAEAARATGIADAVASALRAEAAATTSQETLQVRPIVARPLVLPLKYRK